MASSRADGKTSACKKVLVGLALAVAGAAWAFDAEYTASQTVTISEAGSYLVTGSGDGAITIAANVTGVELTISNVTWTGNATKISIGDGAALALVLEGTSTVSRTARGTTPIIKLPQTSSLVISGTGELNMATYHLPCIGVGDNATMGSLTINGGTVIAHAGNSADWGLSAAIGGGYGNPKKAGNGGTVVVNGGKLVAVGYGDAPGIGGGNCYGSGGAGDAGTLTVNGGHVIAMTRHVGSILGNYASPAIGPGASRQSSAAHGAPGTITVTGGILEAWVDRADASCFGIAHNVGQAATVPAGAGLYVTGGTVKWNHLINDEPNFTYSFANCNVGCSSGPERKLTGLWLPVDTDPTTFFPAGVNFEKATNVTVAANTIALADLASGDVALDSSSPFTIVGSSAASANKITATGSIEAALCGVNSTSGWAVPANSTSTVYVYGGNEIKLSSGIPWTLPETGTLSFKGDGWLFCEAGGNACAIGIGEVSNGKWGTLIVDGPTVQANASYRSSGVGLSYSYNASRVGAGKVVVESGTLIANGRGYAPGIGGGSVHAANPPSIGPEVIVKTNGTIYANNIVDSSRSGISGNPETFAAGVAIGAGVRRDNATYAADAGTITVDGGTIYATVANADMPCFGIVNGKKTGVQNPNGTGSLTVKNGGKVFFQHSDFPGRYTVTIDDGTLGTMSGSPAASWIEFNSLATVTNGLTIAGPVAPELAKLPSFKNNPALNIETGVTITDGMLPDEWVEINDTDIEKVTLTPAVMLRTKSENGRVLTRFEAREGWINLAELTGVYNITENGVYKFYGTGTSPVAIQVAANVVCTNVLADASINVNGGSVAPLELGTGSQVFLQLMGANTMNRIGTSSCAVIRVPNGAALTIADGAEEGEATGSLTIDETNLAATHVVGIGEAGTDSQMGSLTIDSGTITIHMRHDNDIHGGAAIGSAGRGSSCGTVTINGGTVDLDGPGLGPSIGAGTDNVRMGHGGNVTINGGTVIAKGYGGASAIGLAPTYSTGAVGTPGTFTMNGGTLYAYGKTGGSYGTGSQCGAAIGGSGTRNGTTGSTIGQVTINGGLIFLESASACSIGCGKPEKGSEPVARAATDRVTINGGCIWAPQGIQGDAVNAAGQKLKLVSIPNSFFPSYPYTLDLGGSITYTFPNSTFSDHTEHLWLPSCACETGSNLAIVVGTEDDVTPRSYTMSSGATKVFAFGTTTLSSSSALSGTGVIVLGDGSETTFNGLNFTSASGNGYHSTVVVQDNATAKVILSGNNSLQRPVVNDSVIHLPSGAKLTIDGGADDWLRIEQTTSATMKGGQVGIGVGGYDTAKSMGTFVLDGGNVSIQFNPSYNTAVAVGVSGGNRNAGTVIVNGGTLLASSGALSAGIGGGYANPGYGGNGGTVIVNGGVVTAKGYGGAAGIGGGTVYSNNGVCGAGGSFTLNGGTVYAYAYRAGVWTTTDGNRCGAAIGGAAQREKNEAGGMGTVTINDGTLYAYAEVGAAIGHGNMASGSYTIERGSDGAFTVKGGSVKLMSGNNAALYHVTPKNGTLEPPLVTVPARKFGAAPYALEFVERNVAEGATPFAYPYHGSGYGDDTNLYFYLPHGKYRMNGKSCVVNETGVHFPGMVIIVK